MATLIAKYLAKPTELNARRLAAYSDNHPMARVFMSQLERGVLSQAIKMVR